MSRNALPSWSAVAVAIGVIIFSTTVAGVGDALAERVAAATSPCQGLSGSACAAKGDACSWIKAAKLKNGKTRKAHCRKKPKGGFKKKS